MDILSWILTLGISSGQLIRMPYLTGGITALDITVSLFSVIGLLKLRFKLSKACDLSILKKPPFLMPALIFILIALLSLILTPLHLTLAEYLTAFSYTGRFLIYLLFSLVIFSGAFPKLQKNLKKVLISGGIILAVLGLIQLIVFPDLRFLTVAGWDPHYFRTVSTFFDPNFAGAFFVLALILLISFKHRLTPLFFAILYLALLTTFSRSSYLMFLVSGLTFSIVKKSIKYALITLVLFGILLLSFQIYSRLVATPRNISREQSASLRLSTWQQGFEIFQKNPVLGVGFNAYRYAIGEYGLGNVEFLKSHGSSGNDSSLLFVASTTGLIGLLIYLYFLFSILATSNRQILIPAVLGLIVHSFFSNSLFFPPIFVWLMFVAAVPKK